MNLKTREDWEKAFIVSLVRLRDFFEEQDPEEIIKESKKTTIDELVLCYFSEQRRNRIPVPKASSFMNYEDAAIYLNDLVLGYIHDECSNFLILDWREKYIISQEIDESNIFDTD